MNEVDEIKQLGASVSKPTIAPNLALAQDNKALNIQNGDKKSMDLLKFVGAIAAGALLAGGTIHLAKKGKLKEVAQNIDKVKDKVKDKVSKISKKAPNIIEQTNLEKIQEQGFEEYEKGAKEALKRHQDIMEYLDDIK